MTVFLGAGHGRDNAAIGVYDSGAVGSGTTEAAVVRQVLPDLVPLLERVLHVVLIPDTGSLASRITWLMAHSTPDDWAFQLHMNCGGGTGTEVLYSADHPDLAAVAGQIAADTASGIGITNRGAKRDSDTPHGYLGFVHRPACRSFITELGFIDQPSDVQAVQQRAAPALAHAILTALHMANQLTPEQQAAWDRMRSLGVFSALTKPGTVVTTEMQAVFLSRLLDAIKKGV